MTKSFHIPTDAQQVLESIYAAHGEGGSLWEQDICRQVQYVCQKATEWGEKFIVLRLRQNVYNVHMVVTGEPHQVERLDCSLMAWCVRNVELKHLLVLERG